MLPTFFSRLIGNDEPIRQKIYRIIGCDPNRFPITTPCFLKNQDVSDHLYAGCRDFVVRPHILGPDFAIIGIVLHNRPAAVLYKRENNRMYLFDLKKAPTAFFQFSMILGKFAPNKTGERSRFIITDMLAYAGQSCANNDVITQMKLAYKTFTKNQTVVCEWFDFQMIPCELLTNYKHGKTFPAEHGLSIRSVPDPQTTGRSKVMFTWGTQPLIRARIVDAVGAVKKEDTEGDTLMMPQEKKETIPRKQNEFGISLLDSSLKNTTEILIDQSIQIPDNVKLEIGSVYWCHVNSSNFQIERVSKKAERQKPHSTRYWHHLQDALRHPVTPETLFV